MNIWKTVLEVKNFQEIKVPEGAEFICAREQYEDICVWYRCDPEAPLEKRGIYVHGTGHSMIDDTAKYIGTASVAGGKLIWHVFERV